MRERGEKRRDKSVKITDLDLLGGQEGVRLVQSRNCVSGEVSHGESEVRINRRGRKGEKGSGVTVGGEALSSSFLSAFRFPLRSFLHVCL